MENEIASQQEARLAQLSMINEANLLSEPAGARPATRKRSTATPTLLSTTTHLSELSRSLTFRDGISVVAQGDSWFDYIGNDIIKSLSRKGFAIKNFGTAGDTLENMLFGTEIRESNWTRRPHPDECKSFECPRGTIDRLIILP